MGRNQGLVSTLQGQDPPSHTHTKEQNITTTLHSGIQAKASRGQDNIPCLSGIGSIDFFGIRIMGGNIGRLGCFLSLPVPCIFSCVLLNRRSSRLHACLLCCAPCECIAVMKSCRLVYYGFQALGHITASLSLMSSAMLVDTNGAYLILSR